MKIYKLLIGISFLILLLGYGLIKLTIQKYPDDRLIIGMAAGYAPFVSINPAGEYEGFDIDLAEAVANKMGKKLVLKDLGNMTSLLAGLDCYQIDAIIWGMSITQERLQKVAMVHYYGQKTTSYPLVFWDQVPVDVKSINDLAGQVVCVEPNSAQQAILDKYDSVTQLPVEKIDDALLNIQYGKAVAALVDPVIAQKFKTKYAQIKILDIPLLAQDQVDGVGIMIYPAKSQLISDISQAVQELKDTGVIDQLAQKWGMES